MNINHFKYFNSIITYGTMREAARQLFVSEPTISQQIRALEQNLGFPVFHKVGRNIMLTPEGEKLVPVTRKLLDAIKDAEKQIEEIRNPFGGHVRLGLGPITASWLLPVFFENLKDIHSHIKFDVFQEGSLELINMLKSNKIDVGIVSCSQSFQKKFKNEQIGWVELSDINYVATVSRDHPFSNNERMSINEFSNESFLLYHNTSVMEMLISYFGKDFNNNINGSFDSYDTIRDLVIAGMGVSILAESYINRLPIVLRKELHTIHLEDYDFSLKMYCIYNEAKYIPKFTEKVIDVLTKTAKEIF
ncbi:LysR family transcriptional regulator [Sporosarcina sp. 179-K 3D1 HS]|uniref:LysR family transcriptional regulator n=1 Tax=Sporosarcina sp. 179-K 3D1 HS TaxID=3232169 RepID=UPI00399F7CD4